jgi:hypothetical protein
MRNWFYVAIVMLEPVFYESGNWRIQIRGSRGGSGAALEQNSRRAMIALLYLSLRRAQSRMSRTAPTSHTPHARRPRAPGNIPTTIHLMSAYPKTQRRNEMKKINVCFS